MKLRNEARQPVDGWQHALAPLAAPLAVAALCLATLLRFYPAVTSSAPLGDEMAQEKAFLEETAGLSPYLDGNYVYPPSLLRIGAVLRQLPLPSPYIPLRGASILGLAILVWYATGRLAWKPWQRFGVATLYILLAPGVRQGIEFGNLSFAVGGGILLALLVWERSPIGSGLLLGASLLLKPLAPAALVALFFHRPHRPHREIAGGNRHRIAAAVAGVAAALALLADPEFGAFLRHGSHAWVLERTVSLHRFLALAGLREGASILSLLLLAGIAAVARARVTSREQLLAVALAGCVMVPPVVWNHTLVLTLPLQAMAIALATQRYRAAAAAERRWRGWRGWEATGIALAVTALTFGEGATGIDDRAVALQIFATLPPALAPAILAAYVLRFHGTPVDPGAERALR